MINLYNKTPESTVHSLQATNTYKLFAEIKNYDFFHFGFQLLSVTLLVSVLHMKRQEVCFQDNKSTLCRKKFDLYCIYNQ